ncbi:MAG: hypothetical protein K5694_03800 [Bacilli bacterium]|nr:hypothetical protein [Bacilli bacterium]
MKKNLLFILSLIGIFGLSGCNISFGPGSSSGAATSSSLSEESTFSSSSSDSSIEESSDSSIQESSEDSSVSSESSSQFSSEDDDFSLITDTKLAFNYEADAYILKMVSGETYQIRSNIDIYRYQLTYSCQSDGSISIDGEGLVTAVANLEVYTQGFIQITIEQNEQIVSTQQIIVTVEPDPTGKPEIYFDDPNLVYDEEVKWYEITINGGESYAFEALTRYATSTMKVAYELLTEDASEYCSLTEDGLFTGYDTFVGIKSVLAVARLKDEKGYNKAAAYIHVIIDNQNGSSESGFVVVETGTNTKVKNDQEFEISIAETLSFRTLFDGNYVNDTMGISNSNVLSLNSELNKVTAIGAGESSINFHYVDSEDNSYDVSATVTVTEATLNRVYVEGEAAGLAVINGTLVFVNDVYAEYDVGEPLVITDNPGLTYEIEAGSDDEHKHVTLSYGGLSLEYDVLSIVFGEYETTDFTYGLKMLNANKGGIGWGDVRLNSSGNVKFLVIPMWFTDSGNFFTEEQKDQLLEDLNTVLWGEGGDQVTISLKEYYEKASHGKVSITGTVTDFYTYDRPLSDYGGESNSDFYYLFNDAAAWYASTQDGDAFAEFDADNDGKIDNLIVLYAGNYYGYKGTTHSFAFNYTYSENTSGVGVSPSVNNAEFVPFGDFYGYQMQLASATGQLNVEDLSASNAQRFKSAAYTLCHETGHAFGSVDLYTEKGHSALYPSGGHEPCGGATLMDASFEGLDPFHSNSLGWTNSYVFSSTDFTNGQTFDIELDDFQSSGKTILLTREWNEKDSPFDEYMLLELYAPTELNHLSSKSIDDVGVRVWHVDASLERQNNGEIGHQPDEGGCYYIASNHYETDEDLDIIHLIRNNQDEEYRTQDEFSSDDLFHAGDHFAMSTFASQFKNQTLMDNLKKFGWEFDVSAIYKKADGTYSGALRLTKVDSDITDFFADMDISKEVSQQPTEDGTDYALDLLGSDEDLQLLYNFNDGEIPSSYNQGKPIHYKGLCLFASANGNGGSLELKIKPKEGREVKIKNISLAYGALTVCEPTCYVNGQAISGESFEGEYNEYTDYNDVGMKYEINASSCIIQNRTIVEKFNHWSVLPLMSLHIEYSII